MIDTSIVRVHQHAATRYDKLAANYLAFTAGCHRCPAQRRERANSARRGSTRSTIGWTTPRPSQKPLASADMVPRHYPTSHRAHKIAEHHRDTIAADQHGNFFLTADQWREVALSSPASAAARPYKPEKRHRLGHAFQTRP